MVSTRSGSKTGADDKPEVSSPAVDSIRIPAGGRGARAASTKKPVAAPKSIGRSRVTRLSKVTEESAAPQSPEASEASRAQSAEPQSDAGDKAQPSPATSVEDTRNGDGASAADSSEDDEGAAGIGVRSPAAQLRGSRAAESTEPSESGSDSDDSDDEPDPLSGLAASMWQALRNKSRGLPVGATDARANKGGNQALQRDSREQTATSGELTWRPSAPLPPPMTAAASVEKLGTAPTEAGLNKLFMAPPRDKKLAAQQRKAKEQRAWHELPETPITDELKQDLRLLRLRGAMDPKRFYKKAEKGRFPTRFAVGTIVEDSADFYSGRLTNKQRKSTFTDELMADSNLQKSQKRRFSKLQEENQRWSHKKYRGKKPQLKKKAKRPKH